MIRTKKNQTWTSAIYLGLVFLIMAGFFLSVGQQVMSNVQTTVGATTTTVTNHTWVGGASASTELQLYKGILANGSADGAYNKAHCLAYPVNITNGTGRGINELNSGNYTVDFAEGTVLLSSTSEYAGDKLNLTFAYYGDAWCFTNKGIEANANISEYFGLLATVLILTAIIATVSILIISRFM